jgi:osmotically-inducible protein OsmY
MKLRPIAIFLMAGALGSGAAVGFHASPLLASGPTAVSPDQDATQKIRKAIMADKTLSTSAHNVKILTHDGKVTLRGQVRSEAEKQSVAERASAVVGADNVINELTIQPSK